ncbi:MAG: glutamine synthetase type III, partial [Chloroflexota bacterium]|nr:glutamine synthetase type III [Chloroflexota bacterium]
FDAIESGSGDPSTPASFLELGTSVLPSLPMHGGDRNRTSPFAFTGNKFEFRALGSSMSLSLPNTVLNTIVAEAIDTLAGQLQARLDGGAQLPEAVLAVVKESYSATRRVVFGGDNYSEEWHAEAERRGLANLRTTPDALPWLVDPHTVEVFERYGVLSERELESRYEVFVEQYVTKLNIEAETAASIARTSLVPSAVSYLVQLGAAGDGSGVAKLSGELSGYLDQLVDRLQELEVANVNHPQDCNVLEAASYVKDTVIPAMDAVREVADRLERLVPDTLWPLPKYSEILFIK